MHYAAYYREVLTRGDIWPNEVWYHFFFSKGAGLTILVSALLGIAYAQLAGLTYFFGTILIFHDFTVRATRSRSCAWAASTFYTITFFHFDPGASGYFLRHHAEVGSTLIFLVWLSVVIPTGGFLLRDSWTIGGLVVGAGLALISPPGAIYALAFLGLRFVWDLTARNVNSARRHLLWLGGVSFAVASVLWFNYCIFGLPEFTPLDSILKHGLVNEEVLACHTSPMLLNYLEQGMQQSNWYGHAEGKSRREKLAEFFTVRNLAWFYHLDKVKAALPFVCIPLALVFVLIRRNGPQDLFFLTTAGCCMAMLTLCGLAFLVIPYPASVYRQTHFGLFFVDWLAVLSVVVLLREVLGRVHSGLGRSIPILSILAIGLCSALPPSTKAWDSAKVQLRVFLGMAGSVEVFAPVGYQQSFARMRQLVPPQERILLTNAGNHYGPLFLVGRGLEIESISYSFGPDWHRIAFERPEIAATALKRLGIQYFLVQHHVPPYGTFLHSPLFSRESLEEHFSLVWEQDGLFLLTWKKPGIPALSMKFLKGLETIYTAKTWTIFQQRELYERVQQIFRKSETQSRSSE